MCNPNKRYLRIIIAILTQINVEPSYNGSTFRQCQL